MLSRSGAQSGTIGWTILRYGFGVAVPVCVTLGQSLVLDVMRGAVLFPFVAGVFLVARTARLGPAFVATAGSVPLADYFFLGESRSIFSVAGALDHARDLEAQGGQVRVDSELGRGSTFIVELRRAGPSASARW